MSKRSENPSFSLVAEGILTGFWEANPIDAVEVGLHRYDGRLPDHRPASVKRRLARIERDLEALDRQERVAGASRRRHIEAGVLRSRLLQEQFRLVDARQARESLRETTEALSPLVYLLREYAPTDTRLRSIVRIQDQVPEYLVVVRQVLSRHLAETQYEVGEMGVSGVIDSYRNDLPLVLGKASATTRRRVERSSAIAVAALTAFRDELRTRYQPHVRKEFALGRRKYERMLWAHHLTGLSIDRLLEVGEADLAANKRAFVEAASAVAPGKEPRGAVNVIAEDHSTAESLIPDTEAMLEDIRSFVLDHDLVTLPAEERPIVMETPRSFRYGPAWMIPPGQYDKVAKESYYWITPPGADWPPEKQEEWLRFQNRTTMRNVCVHECYPGHFVHGLYRRYRVRSPVMKSSWSMAFVEGWGHYCEAMMVEQGYQRGDPKYRMAQLMDALLRDCRTISSVRMHVFGWRWEDATRFFMENAFIDRLPAESEAKRGTYNPEYINYTLGKLMILKLRKDWMTLHPGASLREFHDAFLSLGAPPLGLAREALLGPGAGPAL